jgi:hypothetical protein
LVESYRATTFHIVPNIKNSDNSYLLSEIPRPEGLNQPILARPSNSLEEIDPSPETALPASIRILIRLSNQKNTDDRIQWEYYESEFTTCEPHFEDICLVCNFLRGIECRFVHAVIVLVAHMKSISYAGSPVLRLSFSAKDGEKYTYSEEETEQRRQLQERTA